MPWKQVAQQTAYIFQSGRGQDYLQPGSLTAVLHKILDEEQHNGSMQTGRSQGATQRTVPASTQGREPQQNTGRPVYYNNN